MEENLKQLLLVDLCGRLPWGIKVYNKLSNRTYAINSIELYNNIEWRVDGIDEINNIKPYLRPMSSMTKEEKSQMLEIELTPHLLVDWLNRYHFDYRGLIPMGLALEAKEGMYKED